MASAISFPSSPTTNQEYTFGNVTYIWDGTRWQTSEGLVDKNKLATSLKGSTILTGVSGTLTINCLLGIHWDITLTGNVTSIVFTNYSTEQFKTITLNITGDYTIAQPTSVKGDWSDYDGTIDNQIQIYLYDVTTPKFSSTLMNL